MDGIYLMTYRGAVGWGQGMLVLEKNRATGADVQGILYDGSYSVGSSILFLELKMTVPPGAVLVQGGPPQPITYSIDFRAAIPISSIEEERPVLVPMPAGPVNVIVKRLRSLGA